MSEKLRVLLAAYGESHRHPHNILIHKFCVPLIFFSVLGLTWDFMIFEIRSTWILIGLGLLFYSRLGSYALTIILPQIIISIAILDYFFTERSAWPVCLTIFVLAWIGQFMGHKIEGRKPSFFEDLLFLLIGPIWVVSSIIEDKTPN